MNTRAQAVAAVRDYTGNPDLELQTFADPKVPGAWALRDAEGNGYLVSAHAPTPATGDHVEEAEWETWPPKPGPLRFFL